MFKKFCNFLVSYIKAYNLEGLHILSWWFWDPQEVKGTMPLPLRVVKRRCKNKFNGIVTSIKTCAPWATICAQKGVGFCIHLVMKIKEQATNGHPNYIISIFHMNIDLAYEKLEKERKLMWIWRLKKGLWESNERSCLY